MLRRGVPGRRADHLPPATSPAPARAGRRQAAVPPMAASRRVPPFRVGLCSASCECSSESDPDSGALEQFARNHHALDLTGSFANGAELDVAIELLHRIVLDESVAAVELDRLVADAYCGLTGEELRHGGLAGRGLS